MIRKIKTRLKRTFKEVQAYMNVFLRKMPSNNKFVIFSQGRTGSNLLESLVNSHPQILCEGEILSHNHVRVLYPKWYIRGNSLSHASKLVYGFRLQPEQLKFHKLPIEDFFSFLLDEDWKIIYLRRENYLRQILSAKIAIHRKKWHYYSSFKNQESKPPQKIEIDVPQLLEEIEAKQEAFYKEKELLQQKSYLEIVYEHDLLNSEKHQETANKVFDYLNLPFVEVETKLQRTPVQNLAEIIHNFQKMEKALKNTKHYHLLDVKENHAE